MLNVALDEAKGIAILEPDGELSKNDFATAAQVIDPYIERNCELRGILIHAKSFPGWTSFSSLLAHFKFIREHHKQVSRIAIATDSSIGRFAEHVADHFVSAEIKTFKFSELEDSKTWLSG